jgi:hypothetical protein
LATTDFDGSLGSPGPPLFTAITRNSYSSPSMRFGAVPLVLLPATSAAFSHGLFARIHNSLVITLFGPFLYVGSA